MHSASTTISLFKLCVGVPGVYLSQNWDPTFDLSMQKRFGGQLLGEEIVVVVVSVFSTDFLIAQH